MFDQQSTHLHRLILLLVTFTSMASIPALANEVSLENAGCPELPPAGRFMSIHLILDDQGNGRECVISADPKHHCEQYHSFEAGFLCLGLTHNPRPDITAAETTNSQRVDRLEVDGEEVKESFGKTILRKDLATGPSGGDYDVIVEHEHMDKKYVLTVGVSAVPDGPVKFDSVRLSYAD